MTITALSDAELIEQPAAATRRRSPSCTSATSRPPCAWRARTGGSATPTSWSTALERARRHQAGAGRPSRSAYLFVTLRRFAAEKAGKAEEESLDDVPEPITEAADSPAPSRPTGRSSPRPSSRCPIAGRPCCGTPRSRASSPRSLPVCWACRPTLRRGHVVPLARSSASAYLQAHLMASPAPDHEPYRSQLGAYVRGGLSARDTAAVESTSTGASRVGPWWPSSRT